MAREKLSWAQVILSSIVLCGLTACGGEVHQVAADAAVDVGAQAADLRPNSGADALEPAPYEAGSTSEHPGDAGGFAPAASETGSAAEHLDGEAPFRDGAIDFSEDLPLQPPDSTLQGLDSADSVRDVAAAVPDGSAADLSPVPASDGASSFGGCGEHLCPTGSRICPQTHSGWSGCAAFDDAQFCGPDCSACSFFNAVAACQSQTCVLSRCVAGWDDCNADPSDGCETPLTTIADCGTCRHACGTNEVCHGGQCVQGGCVPPETNCNGSCVNLMTSVLACGGCAKPCSTQTCVNGACTGAPVYNCPSGYTACDSGCQNLTVSATNCGKCGSSCDQNEVCSGGACKCPAAFAICAGACIDPTSDTNNCGSCGRSCGTGTCVQGICVNPPASTTLALANNPIALALDDAFVYWVEPDTGKVGKVNKIGGSPTYLATGEAKPTGLLVDATNVYWTANLGGAVMKVAKSGGTPAVFATATMPTLITGDSDYVYWVNSTQPTGVNGVWTPGPPPTIWRALKNTGEARQVAADTASPMFDWEPLTITALVIAGDSIYFADANVMGGGGAGQGSLFRVLKSGGQPEYAPRSISYYTTGLVAADCGRVVWTAGFSRTNSSVSWSALDGSEGNTVDYATWAYAGGDSLAMRGRDIYVALLTNLAKVDLLGNLTSVANFTGASRHPLAVDDQYIYWGETDSIGHAIR